MGPDQQQDWERTPTSEFRPVTPPGQAQPGSQFHYGPAGQHAQPPNSYAPGYGPQKQGVSAGLAVALTLLAVLVVGLIGVVVYFMTMGQTGFSAAPVTSTVAVTATATSSDEAERAPAAAPQVQPAPAPAAKPSGAYECTGSGGGQLSHSAVGSSVTSCEFAATVRAAYLGAGGSGESMVVNAYSPVTGKVYSMNCSGGPPVTCSGGNDAVVYIY